MSKDTIFKTKFSENFWSSYAKQTIDCQHAIGELFDNILSARPRDIGGGLRPAFAFFYLEEMENKNVRMIICDNCKGVDHHNLTGEENIFNLGFKPQERGMMNEHGFGLKNALAMLTSGFETQFKFYTKPSGSENIYRVSGPLKEEMIASIVSEDEWNDKLCEEIKGQPSGVKIEIEIKRDYFNSVYNIKSGFPILVRRLAEHLGVMYSDFLGREFNVLFSYKEFGSEGTTNRKLIPIPVPFLVNSHAQKEEKLIKVEFQGKEYEANYTTGTLDSSVREDSSEIEKGWPYPLKIHYRGSNARCGLTLNVRGRVLKTAIFKEIWPEKAGDVSFNNFLAELRVNSAYPTTNNKTDLDPHSELWSRLKEKLGDDYLPEKSTKKQSETQLKNDIVKQIKNVINIKDKNISKNKKVWDGGAEVDIYYKDEEAKITIYELKVLEAKVIDVYQLLMYWDGIVQEKKVSPQKAILVATAFPSYVNKAIDHINEKADKLGVKYNIETKLAESFK